MRARGLLAHEERDYEEWGVSGSVVLVPGASGRSFSVRVGSTYGAASSAAERLWAQRPRTGDAFDPETGLDAEVAYGLGAWGGLLTPYTGVSLERDGETYRLGENLSLSLEGDRREKENDAKPVHGILLRGDLRW